MAMTDTTRTRLGPQALSTAISTVLTMAAADAAAQETPTVGLDEVIVTATKRAERLQDVSESISAFNADAIAMRGLKQIDDIVKYIPGMSISQREPAGTTLVFRGVASSGIQFGAVSSSALYLDEQPVDTSVDPRFIDIERVEALRGPQGTLYGASSQSGTLRVITAPPDPSGFSAWAEAEVNSVSEGDTGYDVSAMVNLPLAEDRLSLRLVGFASEDAGFIDNVLTQSKGQTFDNSDVAAEDVNTVETTGGRAALRLDISDGVDLTLGAIYQDIKADGHGDVTPARDDGFGYPDVGDLEQVRFSKENLEDTWYQLGLTLNAATPIGDLVLSASYFDRDFHYDADATDYEFNFNCPRFDAYYNENPPPPFCQPNYAVYDFGGDPRGFAQDDSQSELTTFEARLQSNNDSESRWSWLVGAFYSKEESHTQFDSFVQGYADTPAFQYFAYLQYAYYGSTLAPTDQWWIGIYDTELEQRAVFGEVAFDLTENFTITAGGRWFEYDRKFRLHQESPLGFTGFSLTEATADTDDSDVVAKLNLTYRINDDRMVYATYSEGFRNGGSNPVRPISILPREFSSDVLKNYEVGAKTEWLDNRVRFNIAVYSMQWDDFAVQVEDPQPGVFQLGYVNLPSAEIQGFESEFSFAIDDAWQLDATLGYNDGEVSEATEIVLDPAYPSIPVDKGARLPLTPDWTASLGLEYRARGTLLNGQPFARLDLAYVGESVNNLEGIESVVAAGGVQVQEAYQTGDFSFGIESKRWSTTLYVDNFWDERASLFLSNRWAEQRLSVNRPRTFGLRFRYSWQ
jgi:outer membrane receptor protein involved in Fe transport